MPDDGFNIQGVEDPTVEDTSLFVAQTNEATNPALLSSMQATFTQDANGYAMEKVSPGITEAFENAEVTVTANPDLLNQVDMAGMLPETQPNFGGGLFADLVSAADNLAHDVADAANTVNPQQPVVVADVTPELQQRWEPPTSSIG